MGSLRALRLGGWGGCRGIPGRPLAGAALVRCGVGGRAGRQQRDVGNGHAAGQNGGVVVHVAAGALVLRGAASRTEEHKSELTQLMRSSFAVLRLKTK